MLREKLRSMIPNIKPLRRKLARERIKRVHARMIDEKTVHNVEIGLQNKRKVVFDWEKSNRSEAKKLNNEIKSILIKNPSVRKQEDWNSYLTDLKFCKYAYGFLPYEFICYDLYKKTTEQRREFISDAERIEMVFKMNDIAAISLFNDKCKTFEAFKNFYRRDCITIENKQDINRFIEFTNTHPRFVKKQSFESVGNSIQLIDMSKENRSPAEVFDSIISNGKHILEDLIEQSSEMSYFNQSSVNTIRCMTVKTSHGIRIPYCFMKCGREGSFVDNGGAGGILIGIDVLTGKLNTNGIDECGNIYNCHPDSGKEFIGYKLPDWDRLKRICSSLAKRIERVQFVGWDLAHSKDFGWVIVEGNGGSQFVGPQTTSGVGMRKTMQKLMDDMNLMI